MSYQIRYSAEAKKALRRLPGNYRSRVKRTIESLADNPFPTHAVALRRELVGLYRIRLDKWRIIYTANESTAAILIIAVQLKRGPETCNNLEE